MVEHDFALSLSDVLWSGRAVSRKSAYCLYQWSRNTTDSVESVALSENIDQSLFGKISCQGAEEEGATDIEPVVAVDEKETRNKHTWWMLRSGTYGK
jgi:hypothetical protein